MSIESGFRIGSREIFPLESRIVGPGGALRVEPKAMSVLLELARHAPAARSREEILQVVWPRGYVGDDALTRCIGQLRRALGDDPKAPTCLETLPKRGYRLKASIEPHRPDGTAGTAVVRPRDESLIVLPFQNLSAGAEDFIADGITELLILRLAGLRHVRVISRTTSMQFKATRTSVGDIAARTGADWVIEGSVLQADNLLQVVVQLIDARTDAHFWAADYLRDLRDLLPLQNEIAGSVATAIRLQLGSVVESPRAAPALAPPVVRDYLRGRHLVSRRTVPSLREARQQFAAVTEAAPDYAAGWASLAECDLLLAHYGAPDPTRAVESCERNVERALAIEPDLGIALSTRGAARFFFRCDLDGAISDLERALNALPSYALAMLSMANVHAVRHEFAEASAWIEQALLVDPLDVGINMNLGDHMILQRRYGDALRALRRALEVAPGHRPSQLRMCWALALDGQYQESAEQLDGLGPTSDADAPWFEYAALVASASGNPQSATRHYAALEHLATSQRVPPWTMARAAAAAQQNDAALAWLEAAAREHSSSLPFLFVTPAFCSLHADARFQVVAGNLLGPPARTSGHGQALD